MERPTKKESGCPTDKPSNPIVTQRRWRAVCSVLIVCVVGMALYGVQEGFFADRPLYALVYWAVFLLLLAAIFFIVILDIRYIRLQYAVEKRELLRQTMGDETFRKALISAQRETNTTSTEGEKR